MYEGEETATVADLDKRILDIIHDQSIDIPETLKRIRTILQQQNKFKKAQDDFAAAIDDASSGADPLNQGEGESVPESFRSMDCKIRSMERLTREALAERDRDRSRRPCKLPETVKEFADQIMGR